MQLSVAACGAGEEGIGSLVAGVTGGCETVDMAAMN